jgi:uncharacterized membrane protein
MTNKRYARAALVVSAAGTAFSGYLSAKRMTSGICAFDESCPFFLGHPACYYGFALFAALLFVAVVANVTRTQRAWPAAVSSVLAIAGVAFASTMTTLELQRGVRHPLLLPTCAWGAVFFAAALGLAIAALVKGTRSRPVAA